MEGSWYLGADGRIINRMKVTDFKYLSGYFLIMEKTEKFFSCRCFVGEIV